MRPFFSYYGGKWRAAPLYPGPLHNTIVEPFAGSAGYSTRYYQHDVRLFDADPVIAGVWDYLIRTPAAEIRRLPAEVSHVSELGICQEARWLIGFWLNKGTTSPRLSPSRRMRERHAGDQGLSSWWGEGVRERIASQCDLIRHWRIACASYESVLNVAATWFIDPPYDCPAGAYYKYRVADYGHLGEWCERRNGQAIVCEKDGASWLPFRAFMSSKSMEGRHGKRRSAEAIWTRQAADKARDVA